MKRKVLGIFVVTLLIATVVPAVGNINNSFQRKNPVDKSLNGGWEKTFDKSEFDFGDYVMQTSDGGYIIGGETMSSAGDIDIWLIKTDSDGNLVWDTTIGGSDSDVPNFICEMNDGYLITGLTRSYGAGDYDAWLIKTDTNGNEQWNKTYGGAGYDFCWTVFNTTDGGYIMGGGTNTYGAGNFDYWMIKTDSAGNEIWNKTFGGSDSELFRGMRETNDGNYILVGFVTSTIISQKVYCWLVKTDADGNTLWDKKIEETESSGGTCIQQTSDGGYIVSGEKVALSFVLGPIFFYVGGDMWLVKIDADGNTTWEKSFGGKLLEDSARCVELTDEGGYILAGCTKGFGSVIKQAMGVPIFSKIYVVETDADGNKIGEKEFSRGLCWYIDRTSDGGHIITGGTKPYGECDIILIKLD